MARKLAANYFRHVLEGKGYEGGNHVGVANRRIFVEFDSDFYLVKRFNGKNWFKLACRQAERIPDPVSIQWFVKEGYEIPDYLKKEFNLG